MNTSDRSYSRRARLSKGAILAATTVTGAAMVAWFTSKETVADADKISVQGPEFKDTRVENTDRAAALPANVTR